MLNLLCGPSGSGKASCLLEKIREDILAGRKCLLLLPEQQAYISERDLPALLPENAGLWFETVNFSGLAEDVFREYGGVTQLSSNPGLSAFLMWDTLRTQAPLLRQYGSVGSDPALTGMMLRAVAELHSSGIDATLLEDAAQKLPQDHPLQKKLSDLALIDAVYHEKMQECFGDDPADLLLRLTETLREHSYFRGYHIYIDSFTDFTVPEYAVLRELLRQADSVTVSLCMDAPRGTLPHFEVTRETARHLTKLSGEVGCAMCLNLLTAADARKPEVFRVLERELWDYSVRSAHPLSDGEATAVRAVQCANLYEESEAVALQIQGLVQSGMCYGDIAVMVRDTEVYCGVLDAALERHGIPFFLSERTDLSVKPLFRLILSALRIIGRNYRQADVITLLKTGLCGVSAADAASFEEYCETWHLNGSRFRESAWSMNPDGLTVTLSARGAEILSAANRVRERLIPPLEAFSASMKLSHRLSDRCRALYAYLTSMDIPAALSARAKAELGDGKRREAGETLRLWQTFTEILSTLCRILPDAELTTDEFSTALSLLLSGSDLGSVPNVQDCVMIGSAATLRVENVRAMFLLGLCEGEFPAAAPEDSIFSDADKVFLEGVGLKFRSGESTRYSEELFYLYRAVTKPQEFLWISAPLLQPDGSARTPSVAFSRICFLLQLTPEFFRAEEVQRLCSDEKMPLPHSLAVSPASAPVTLRLSQSKITAFVLCPYRYYSTYCLSLREKKDSAPNYADDGIFLHYIFEKLISSSIGADGSLSLPAPEETEAVADRLISDYLHDVFPMPPEEMDQRLLHLFSRLRSLALAMLRDILAELRAGAFRPALTEQSIGGSDPGRIPAPRLELPDGSSVLLVGKIDRVDLWEDDGKTYVRVVDYKSGKHTFSEDEVRSGRDIQLVLYLSAFLSTDPDHLLPAGAQYLYAVNQPGLEIHRTGFLLSEEKVLRAADGTEDGIFAKRLLRESAEEIRQLEADMRAAVTGIAGRILSGEAEKTPSADACTFCPVREHCDRAIRKGGSF